MKNNHSNVLHFFIYCPHIGIICLLTENWETLVRNVKPEALFWHTVRQKFDLKVIIIYFRVIKNRGS